LDGVRESYVGFAYNTRFLKAVMRRKTTANAPALRDMAIAGEDTGARIIGAMLKQSEACKRPEQNMRMHMMAGALGNSSPPEKSSLRQASLYAQRRHGEARLVPTSAGGQRSTLTHRGPTPRCCLSIFF
jgi:hypothetical protein